MASQTETAKSGKQLVKVSVFFNKKPDITEEEFHRYWSEKHGPLVRSLPIVQKNILKYNQYHTDLSMRSKAVSLGLPVLEYDGIAEFVSTDMAILLKTWMDPEFHQVVTPDEQKFMTREGVKFMIGYDDVMMDRT